MALKSTVLISSIQLAPSDTAMPLTLSQCQLPLRLTEFTDLQMNHFTLSMVAYKQILQ